MNFHFLFEQSGTFKNAFKEFGNNCYDYDILNEYNETDFVCDIFNEIEKCYNNESSIFDNIKENDFIIAFFPCTYFCDRNELIFKLWNGGKKLDFNKKRANDLLKRNVDRCKYFDIYIKFCYICKEKKIKTIIENPASGGSRNYLEMFSPVEISYKEKNRALFGDEFKKPTNYFSINFEMKEKFFMFYDNNIFTKRILDIQSKKISTGERSKISKTYAKNFYKRFIEGRI